MEIKCTKKSYVFDEEWEYHIKFKTIIHNGCKEKYNRNPQIVMMPHLQASQVLKCIKCGKGLPEEVSKFINLIK